MFTQAAHKPTVNLKQSNTLKVYRSLSRLETRSLDWILKAAEKVEVLETIKGEADLSLNLRTDSGWADYARLGLIIIDEQASFWCGAKAYLRGW